MNPMAAAVAGALISGMAMYAVGAGAAQRDAFAENPALRPGSGQALVQTLDGQYLAPAQQPRAMFVSNPAPATRVVRTQSPTRTVYRPAETRETVVYRDEEVRPERTKTKTALIIGGSAASGAGVGAIFGGKKGALIGAAIGGGAASIYEASRRR